jgi:hypothetical protein
VQSQPLDLRDRLVADAERHFIPRMQALMRLPLEQARRDHARGIRTGTLITGYFGRQRSRREERDLISWYENLLDQALPSLDAGTLPLIVELAELPSTTRGYEDIKSRNAVRARARGGKLLRRLEDPTLPVAIAGQHVGD